MAKYVYPAVFTREENGLYSVNFPDIQGCFTSGDDLADAMVMAEDVLEMTLYCAEKEGAKIPEPSKAEDLKPEEGSFVNLVYGDTMKYQKKFNKKAVKKTLTIPEWLNELATEANINFSQVLQEALMEKLNA